MVDVLHQLGFRHKWNLRSFEDDGVGEGVICAPRYMKPEDVSSLPKVLRSSSLFDPQFFIPNSSQGKLPEYHFFPDVVADGFSTTDYSDNYAADSAARCVQFQMNLGFSHIVVPSRHREATPSDFIESQSRMFLEPFVQAASEAKCNQPILLQLILNDAMLKDERFRNGILNWVTGIPEVAGVYLIPQVLSRQKQITDIDYLLALLGFVRTLRLNGMEVVVGYLNTEAIPLLAADPTAVTIGAYENLRMFSLKAFENEEATPTRGPTARIYASHLLQWINHQYLGAIDQVLEDAGEFFDDSQYRVSMFEPDYKWHFTRPEPYLHYFSVFSEQLKRIADVDGADRYAAIKDECQSAIAWYQKLEELGIVFDADSGSSHLGPWITAINLFEKKAGINDL